MKYNCEIIQDLMPLCADNAGAEESKNAVHAHLAECKDCEQYYSRLIREVSLDEKQADEATSEYTAIARRIRRRNLRRRSICALTILASFLLLFNYALGYRISAKTAAGQSGKLNASSQLLGTYEWGNVEFFFYDSKFNYDTIASEKHWNGWKSDVQYFVSPKYPSDEGRLLVTSGLNYWRGDKGILLLPVFSDDMDVVKATITAFGQTKSMDINTHELAVFAFENQDLSKNDDVIGSAYDKNGNIKYELRYDTSMVRWTWDEVTGRKGD